MRVANQARNGEVDVELLDDDGTVVPADSPYLRHLRARGYSPNTLLAYAHDLQRFFRFSRSAGVGLGDFLECDAPAIARKDGAPSCPESSQFPVAGHVSVNQFPPPVPTLGSRVREERATLW